MKSVFSLAVLGYSSVLKLGAVTDGKPRTRHQNLKEVTCTKWGDGMSKWNERCQVTKSLLYFAWHAILRLTEGTKTTRCNGVAMFWQQNIHTWILNWFLNLEKHNMTSTRSFIHFLRKTSISRYSHPHCISSPIQVHEAFILSIPAIHMNIILYNNSMKET